MAQVVAPSTREAKTFAKYMMAKTHQKQTRKPEQSDDDARQNDLANNEYDGKKYQQRDRGAPEEFDVLPVMRGQPTRPVEIGPFKYDRPYADNDQPRDHVMSRNKGV